MPNARTLILFSIALILALAAVFVARRIIASRQVEAPAVARSINTVPIVQANKEIPYLSTISPSQVRLIEVPKESLPFDTDLPGGGFDYLGDPAEAIGKIVTQTVHPGELIVRHRLRDHLGGAPLAHVLHLDRRAVTIRATDVTGVGGFVVPGSLVDVLIVRKGDESAHVDDVLQAVRVLAIDQESSLDKDKPALVHSITLELTPGQAEKVALGQEDGTVQLTLRNPLDKAVVSASEPTPRPSAQPAPKPVVSVTLLKAKSTVTYSCAEEHCKTDPPSSSLPRIQPE